MTEEKLGIDEILKVIDIAKGNILSIGSVDMDLFVSQCKDLDATEDMEVIIEVGKAAIEILALFGTGGMSSGIKAIFKIARLI